MSLDGLVGISFLSPSPYGLEKNAYVSARLMLVVLRKEEEKIHYENNDGENGGCEK